MNRFEKLFELLPDTIDCVLIGSDINRRYFSGMKSSAGYILAFKEKAYLIIDFRYIEKAKKTVKKCEVVLLNSFKNQARDLMALHNAKVVGIESEKVTISELEGLKRTFEGYELEFSNSLSNAITELRAVKSKSEIAKIECAQNIAEKAFEHVLNIIKPGRTEKEIALELDFFMQKNGAEAISFDTIVLTGKNTSLPHGVPSDNKIEAGDFILMDFGAVCDGYHSDMTRTVCVGAPDEEQQLVYNIVAEAQNKALCSVKAGIKGNELDKLARDVIIKEGYGEYFGHSLGHGVGMEIHESPNASPSSESVLKENMILTIEPGIYIPDKFGVRIEDFVIIKKDGCHNITKITKKLICL